MPSDDEIGGEVVVRGQRAEAGLHATRLTQAVDHRNPHMTRTPGTHAG